MRRSYIRLYAGMGSTMTSASLSFLTMDPVAMAEKVIADLGGELTKLKTQRDQEMLPWYERMRAAGDDGDRRSFSQRMREIERNYEGSILMLEREIVRISGMLPPKTIFIEAPNLDILAP